MYKILAKPLFGSNQLHYLPSCHSTNEIAQQMLDAGAIEGTIVITDDQFSGKGQAGNTWVTEKGKNLTFSLILHPSFMEPKDQFLITVAISLAIKNVLDELLPGETMIKWPNDIYFNERKIGGLLIENVLRGKSIESCIIGLGLNVNQVEFPQELNATSIIAETGTKEDLNELLNTLVVAISRYYEMIKVPGIEQLTDKYHHAMLGMGQKKRYRVQGQEFVGEIKGTDEYGRLLLEKEGKLLAFQHKEIEMLV